MSLTLTLVVVDNHGTGLYENGTLKLKDSGSIPADEIFATYYDDIVTLVYRFIDLPELDEYGVFEFPENLSDLQ